MSGQTCTSCDGTGWAGTYSQPPGQPYADPCRGCGGTGRVPTVDEVIADLLVDMASHMAGVRRLMPSRIDDRAAGALRDELEALIRDAQQLEGTLADAAAERRATAEALLGAEPDAYTTVMDDIHGGDGDA